MFEEQKFHSRVKNIHYVYLLSLKFYFYDCEFSYIFTFLRAQLKKKEKRTRAKKIVLSVVHYSKHSTMDILYCAYFCSFKFSI